MISLSNTWKKYKIGILIAIVVVGACGILSLVGNHAVTSQKVDFWVNGACEFLRTNKDFQNTYGTIQSAICDKSVKDSIKWQDDVMLIPVYVTANDTKYLVWVAYSTEYSQDDFALEYAFNVYSVETLQ